MLIENTVFATSKSICQEQLMKKKHTQEKQNNDKLQIDSAEKGARRLWLETLFALKTESQT